MLAVGQFLTPRLSTSNTPITLLYYDGTLLEWKIHPQHIKCSSVGMVTPQSMQSGAPGWIMVKRVVQQFHTLPITVVLNEYPLHLAYSVKNSLRKLYERFLWLMLLVIWTFCELDNWNEKKTLFVPGDHPRLALRQTPPSNDGVFPPWLRTLPTGNWRGPGEFSVLWTRPKLLGNPWFSLKINFVNFLKSFLSILKMPKCQTKKSAIWLKMRGNEHDFFCTSCRRA